MSLRTSAMIHNTVLLDKYVYFVQYITVGSYTDTTCLKRINTVMIVQFGVKIVAAKLNN